MPYQVAVRLDKLCNLVGLHKKTVRAKGLNVRVRRQTCDEWFVQNVLIEETYGTNLIHRDDIVIDIGGNIGTFTLLAAKNARAVYTFEPNSENYSLLQQNLRMNRLTNVTAVNAAVSSKAGTVKLACASEGGYHTLGHRDNASHYEMVESVTLGSIFDRYNIHKCHVLKLDCEGSEYDILHTLPMQYIERIDRIVMEWHGVKETQSHQQADALADYLQQVGFHVDEYTRTEGWYCGLMRATSRSGRA
jgi:FkbM family methyltransferase